MNQREAREHGRPPGYAVQVQGDDDDRAYLADYRSDIARNAPYTYEPDRAEYHQYLADARDRAALVQFLTGLECRACTVPPAVSPLEPPCRCDDRVRLSDGRELDCTVDEMAMLAAIEELAADLDDDDAELIEADHSFHLPGGVPKQPM